MPDQLADDADLINSKLSAGLHVIVSPGIYKIDKPLQLQHPGQVLLGLGLATLIASNGNIVIQVTTTQYQKGLLYLAWIIGWQCGRRQGGRASRPGWPSYEQWQDEPGPGAVR